MPLFKRGDHANYTKPGHSAVLVEVLNPAPNMTTIKFSAGGTTVVPNHHLSLASRPSATKRFRSDPTPSSSPSYSDPSPSPSSDYGSSSDSSSSSDFSGGGGDSGGGGASSDC